MGIKNRLLLLALLPGTVIALVLFIYFTRGQLELLNQSQHEQGLTIARQLAPASEYGFVSGNPQLLGQLAGSLMQQADVTGISIADPQGRQLFAEGSLANLGNLPAPQGEDAELCADSGDRMLFCAPIIKTQLPISDFPASDDIERRIIGHVYVETSTLSMQSQRSTIIFRALLMSSMLLFITGLIAVRIGTQISLPIVAMTREVGKVAEGNLDLHVSAGSFGEIGQLEQGIDSMVGALRVARDEMRSNIDSATARLRQALGELEKRNRDLEEQRLHAQAASEAKSRFLANMSHEIRTPLSGMVGLLFMLRQTKPSPEQNEYLDNLENSAASLRALIDDILDLSRIEAGRLTIHEQEFVLRDLLAGVASMLAPATHQKGVEFIVHVAKDVPRWVMGDPLRLRQILTNLIGNAVKFTERGYVRLHVGSSLDSEHHILVTRFTVEDSGIGIASEKLEYIFESFAQADESTTRRYGGSGLGTTISRELVTLMGGTLKVESEEGRGTRFIFELPLGVIDSDEEEPLPYAGKRALLLEAHGPSRLAERELLESLGFEVKEFAEAEPLMALLEEKKGDYYLLVVAENDRDSSRQEMVWQLRQRVAYGQMPRLLHLTFMGGMDDAALFDGVLHKPLCMEHLAAKLHQMLGGGKQVAEPEAVDSGYGSLKILVAEDDHINAKVMSYFLTQKGHQVVLATNGRAALGLLQQQHFDLGFIDLRMPEMDGLMVARQWRSDEKEGRRLPLIAVTANVTRDDRAACFEAGMDDFVSKPVDPVRLCELLDKYVQRS
ncbi:MAG TPA: ATP-binding protein [Gammaproteobacteria bacterium]